MSAYCTFPSAFRSSVIASSREKPAATICWTADSGTVGLLGGGTGAAAGGGEDWWEGPGLLPVCGKQDNEEKRSLPTRTKWLLTTAHVLI